MSVRMWLNIGVRSVDVLEHWGIDLHVKPRRHGGTTVPEHEYLHPHMRRCRREQGGRCGRGPGIGAVGVVFPGDSAGSAGPVRALEDPELSMRVTSVGGVVAEVAPPSTRAHRHAIPRSSPCSLMARGVWCVQEKAPGRHGARGRKQRWRGCTRVQAQDDKEPSTPSFRLDREVNDGRGGRKVSEMTQIRGTIEKEDKTQMRLSSGSRAAERTLAQSDLSRNTALNPALNPNLNPRKMQKFEQGWPGPWPNPSPEISLQLKYAAEMKKLAPSKLQARNGPGYPVLVRIRSDHNDRSLMHESAKEVV
ncbi:hypothetical protein C8J57DRAFT_1234628 [Mycena rebaudengoi]|nr:hypothetical protein C8J57DRAFT_1234628 [Mycena rebaudengoi]